MSGRKGKEPGGSERSSRQLKPAYMIWFAFCFMLFIYEPLLMYSTNKNDFWFDFWIMILPTLVIFVLFLITGQYSLIIPIQRRYIHSHATVCR